MSPESIPHPPVSDRSTWQQARAELLAAEKALTRERDRVNALATPTHHLPLHVWTGMGSGMSCVHGLHERIV